MSTPLPAGMNMQLRIAESMDIVRARADARQLASVIGFSPADQTRLATAVSELARNILQYAGHGSCEMSDISNNETLGIQILFEDNGPGIPDVPRAIQDGFSTGGGLGAGLPGTKRLMDKFGIESRPGLTRVSIAMIRHRV